jgi:hypothetical protein
VIADGIQKLDSCLELLELKRFDLIPKGVTTVREKFSISALCYGPPLQLVAQCRD